MTTAVSSTEFQNNFGKYLKMVEDGEEVVITKNKKDIAVLMPKDKHLSLVKDEFFGMFIEEYKNADRTDWRVQKYEDLC